MDTVVFRKRFKELKAAYKLSYEDIAKSIGVTCDCVKSHLRKDANMPKLNTLELYANLFGVDVSYLIGSQDCKKKHIPKE